MCVYICYLENAFTYTRKERKVAKALFPNHFKLTLRGSTICPLCQHAVVQETHVKKAHYLCPKGCGKAFIRLKSHVRYCPTTRHIRWCRKEILERLRRNPRTALQTSRIAKELLQSELFIDIAMRSLVKQGLVREGQSMWYRLVPDQAYRLVDSPLQIQP